MNLILASSSKNRQQALTIANIPYKAVPANIDEATIQDNDIKVRTIKLARAKVETVAKKHSGLILGADGVNLVGDNVFEKPKSKTEAVHMIKAQAGMDCRFLTGYFILNTHTGKTYQGHTESRYRFSNLTDQEITKYVNSEPVMNWAAAFSPINSSAIKFIEWMQGSPSQFCFSMPLEIIVPILKQESVI